MADKKLGAKRISMGFFVPSIHDCILNVITQPSIYGVIVYFLLCHESLNYSTGQ